MPLPGVGAPGTAGTSGVATTRPAQIDLSAPVTAAEKQKAVNTIYQLFQKEGLGITPAQIELLLKDIDTQFELLMLAAVLNNNTLTGAECGTFVYNIVEGISKLTPTQIKTLSEGKTFSDSNSALKVFSSKTFFVLPPMINQHAKQPVNQAFIKALIESNWGPAFDPAQIITITDGFSYQDASRTPRVAFYRTLDMALQISRDGSKETKAAAFEMVKEVTECLVKNKGSFDKHPLLAYAQVERTYELAGQIISDQFLKPQFKAAAIQDYLIRSIEFPSQNTSEFSQLGKIDYQSVLAQRRGDWTGYHRYEEQYQTLAAQIDQKLAMALYLPITRAYAQQYFAEQGIPLSASDLQFIDQTLTTPEACDFFMIKIRIFSDPSLADIRDSITLNDLLQTLNLTEDSQKIYNNDDDLYYAVLKAFDIPHKKLVYYGQKSNTPISEAMQQAVANFTTITQLSLLDNFLQAIADPQSQQPGILDTPEIRAAFLSGCIDDLLKITEPLAEADYDHRYKEIFDKNYEKTVIFPRCVEFIQSTGEGQSIADLEALMAPLTPEQRSIFIQIIQSTDFSELAKAAPNVRLADFIAFCQDPKKTAKMAAISDPKEQFDYFTEQIFARADSKTLTYSGELFGDSSGIFSASAKMAIPIYKGTLWSLSGSRSQYKMPPFGNSADTYRSTAYSATGTVSRTFKVGQAGNTIPGIGIQYSALQDGSSIRTVSLSLGAEQQKDLPLGQNRVRLSGKTNLSPYLNVPFFGFNAELSAQGDFGVGRLGRISPLLIAGYTRTAEAYSGSVTSANMTPDTLSSPRNEIPVTGGAAWNFNEHNSISLYDTYRHVNEIGNGSYSMNSAYASYAHRFGSSGLSISVGPSAFTLFVPGEAPTTDLSFAASFSINRAAQIGQ